MSTPSRALTNDYRDCKLIKLDSNDPASPLVVMQEGYAPGDSKCRMRMFYLQRDGFWIDEIARSTRLALSARVCACVAFDGNSCRALAGAVP